MIMKLAEFGTRQKVFTSLKKKEGRRKKAMVALFFVSDPYETELLEKV